LGFAFGPGSKKPDWHYRLNATVPDTKLAEVFPVMAALNVLMGVNWSRSAPFVLGLEITGDGDAWEIDLALALNDSGPPIIVVGEVKSHQDSIDANDLAHLKKVQDFLGSKEIECYILAATLRDELAPDEVEALRALCEGCGDVRGSLSLQPLTPIVLTGKNLSAPYLTEDHPSRWEARQGFPSFALESCKQNLGLVDIRPRKGPTNVREWAPSWAGTADA
jgi:hypothetical protein